MVKVEILLTHADAQVPSYAKEGDSGSDVRVLPSDGEGLEFYKAQIGLPNYKGVLTRVQPRDWIFQPGETKLLPLGFKVAIPEGFELQVRPRSGMAKGGFIVPNSPGTIDSGYRGPVMVIVKNDSPNLRMIKAQDRVAQLCLKRAPQAEFVIVDELNKTDRGEGGLGHTGVN